MRAPAHLVSLLDADGRMRALAAIEGEAIVYALAHYRGQMSRVANALGIGRSTLYRKLKTLAPAALAAVRR